MPLTCNNIKTFFVAVIKVKHYFNVGFIKYLYFTDKRYNHFPCKLLDIFMFRKIIKPYKAFALTIQHIFHFQFNLVNGNLGTLFPLLICCMKLFVIFLWDNAILHILIKHSSEVCTSVYLCLFLFTPFLKLFHIKLLKRHVADKRKNSFKVNHVINVCL